MRVLHLDSGREMRGGQHQVLRLLDRLGAGHTLLTPAQGPLMSAARARGIDAQPLNLWSLAALARSADLIHAHDARTHTWAAAIASVPLVVSRRVAFPVRTSALSRWKYRRPQLFLAISDFVKQTLLAAEVSNERIEVIYDGVEIPERAASGGAIVAPASSDPMKGADLVARAAELGGFDVCHSTDLERDLPGAAVLVYITRSEGLGSAALLAMAYGVPVVGSRTGGLPEVVEDNVTGRLTENDPAAIREAIVEVLANHDELARNARQRAAERFSVDRMVAATRRAYGRVLGC